MKLSELNPLWVTRDGRRIGFTFFSPAKLGWRQSCFITPIPLAEQEFLFVSLFGSPHNVQLCDPKAAWKIEGGIEEASFDTLTVSPSIDGSAGGLWHGTIRNGSLT